MILLKTKYEHYTMESSSLFLEFLMNIIPKFESPFPTPPEFFKTFADAEAIEFTPPPSIPTSRAFRLYDATMTVCLLEKLLIFRKICLLILCLPLMQCFTHQHLELV